MSITESTDGESGDGDTTDRPKGKHVSVHTASPRCAFVTPTAAGDDMCCRLDLPGGGGGLRGGKGVCLQHRTQASALAAVAVGVGEWQKFPFFRRCVR